MNLNLFKTCEMVVTSKCISEIQEMCEDGNGDLFSIHLLGCLQNLVITSDDVAEEAKIGELFKNIYPSNLHVLSTENDAVNVKQ